MPDGMQKIEELKKSYMATFNSESGKKVLADLEKKCHTKNTTFAGDANRMIFREGQRSIYLHIKSMMEMDIERLKEIVNQGGENE